MDSLSSRVVQMVLIDLTILLSSILTGFGQVGVKIEGPDVYIGQSSSS
jgi:hypothetical protein